MRSVLIIILFFCSLSVNGTNYYVKNTGNDDLTGLSDAQAWKTMTKVNAVTFQPGDSVLFKCGDEWREQMITKSSGTSSNYIVYSSYGVGDKPLITGTIRYTGWKVKSENLYYVINAYPSGEFCMINNRWGKGVAYPGPLDSQDEFMQIVTDPAGEITDTFFIYTAVPSDTSNVICSIAWYSLYSADTNYQMFNGLRFSRGGICSAYIIGCNRVEINNCVIDSSGATGLIFQGSTNYIAKYNTLQYNGSDAIWMGLDANYGEIYANTIRFNGLGNTGDRQAIGVWVSHDIKIHYNYIYHTMLNVIEMSSHYNDHHQTNIEIAYNTIIGANTSTCLMNIMFGDYRVHHNTLRITKGTLTTTCLYTGEFNQNHTIVYFYYNMVIGGTRIFRPTLQSAVSGNSIFDLRNNVFYNINYKYYDLSYLSADALLPYVTSDYNVFCSDVGSLWRCNATNYNFAGWQTVSGQDAHSKALPVGWSGKVDFTTVYK